MKHRSARRIRLVSALFTILSFVALGVAFPGVTLFLDGSSTADGNHTRSIASAIANGLVNIGQKRSVPLAPLERPYLNLTVKAPRTRAIDAQNVDLTPGTVSDVIDPVWSPDGSKILFASNGQDTNNDGRIDTMRPDGTYHIWMMDPDGSNQRQITNDPGSQVEPAWSLSQSRIAYASNEGGDWDIYLLTISTGVKIKLNVGASEERHPTWAAGGDKIAFVSDRSGIAKIWSINADNTTLTMLSSAGPSEDRNPVWSLDGQRIAFQSNGADTNGDGVIDGVTPNGEVHVWVMPYTGAQSAQQRRVTSLQLTTGTVINKDPAWYADGNQVRLSFASNRKDTNGDGAWDSVGDFDIYEIAYRTPLLADDPTNTVQRTQRAPNETLPLTGNETHPSMAPNQTYNPKYVYSSDQTGSGHIWITSVRDITQPRLTELPSVSPQQNIPGGQVTITAKVSDLESGIAGVYAQVRDPDDSVTDFAGQEHKVYHVQTDDVHPQGTALSVWTEVDCHMVDSRDYSFRIPPYTPPMDDATASLAAPPPDAGWLQLYDDGDLAQHGDQVAGDGVYSNKWVTPPVQSDYYLDVIAYDNAGNWKIYDGLAGFTTEQFTATRGVLLVMDYAHGQKFMQGDRGAYTAGDWFFPTWFPVESYYTRNPTAMGLNAAQYANNVVNTTVPTIQALGARDTFQRNLDYEGYDLWRIICRGPVPSDVLLAYTPRAVNQPSVEKPYETTVVKKVAERCVFWVSPYAGDLWVGRGTITDTDTQARLVNFMDNGGRLTVTGQDVAWALTRNNPAATPPLLQKMGVRYIDDASSDTLAGLPKGDQRLFLQPEDNRAQIPWAWHDISSQAAYNHRPGRLDMPSVSVPGWGMFGGRPIPTVSFRPTTARNNANHTDTDAAQNQYWIDSIAPIAPAVTTHEFTANSGVTGNNTGVAAVRKIDPDTQAYSFYCAFGIEGIAHEYSTAANDPRCFNERWYLAHNVICWMRTGTVYGIVEKLAGRTPVQNALVRAMQGTNVVGQALTRADGTYEIQGLPSGTYSMRVIAPGYSYDHAQTPRSVHGAGSTQWNILIAEAPPGSISGRVTQPDATTPIVGATVTAILQGSAGETRTATTNQFGEYTIPNCTTGLYELKANADGYAEATYGSLVEVEAGADAGNNNFVMGGVPGGITGRVLRDTDRQIVAGATVELRSGTTLVKPAVTTGNDGKFTFDQVPAGNYELVVTGGPGILATPGVAVTVVPNTTVTKDVLALTPAPATVSGTVRDSLGQPVSGATVKALNGTQVAASAISAGDGTYTITGLTAGTFDITAEKPGFSCRPQRVVLAASQTQTGVNLTLDSLHVFGTGLALVSAPYDYAATDVAALLGLPAANFRFATWQPTLSDYALYPAAPANRLRLGTGYFMQLNSAAPLNTQGTAAPTDRRYEIPIVTGWNMIGNPFPFIVNWFDAQVRVDGQTMTLQQAIDQDYIKNALWTYSGGQYRLAFQLTPWAGYWVKATRPLTLLIPNAASRSRAVDPYRSRKATADSWNLQLVATAGSLRDASNYLGVSRGSQEEYDTAGDVPEAPPTGMADWVQLTFPHGAAWGRNAGDYAVDMRAPSAGEKTWEMEIGTSLANTDVTVTWPNASQLPRRYTAYIVDVETGARRYLRSSAGYTFRSGPQGGSRRFRVCVTTQAIGRLMVNNLQVMRSRGNGALLSFELSDTANVRVQIASASGRVVREVIANKVQSPGLANVSWDGRDAKGQTVGSGLYMYQVEAVTEDGRTVRQSRPFLYTR